MKTLASLEAEPPFYVISYGHGHEIGRSSALIYKEAQILASWTRGLNLLGITVCIRDSHDEIVREE